MPHIPLYRRDPYRKSITTKIVAVNENGVQLEDVLFYPTGGGQPGDTGILHWQGGEAKIIDTRKTPDGLDALHILAPESPLPAPGMEAEIILDWERRHAHMRMHTCLHLLSAVVPASVTGGQVNADRSRLDFNIESGELDKAEIEAKLNALIAAAHPVTELWISDEELAAKPELVKTMSVKPPTGHGHVRLLKIGDGIDLQPCGGTHVANTAEIGPVEIVKIENKGKMNKRVIVALK